MEQIPAPLHEAMRLRSIDRLAEQTVQSAARFEREMTWDSLPPLTVNPELAEHNRIVTVNRSNPAYSAFDMLRTRLLQCLRQNGWTSVAITSPRASCGKSVVALNLAFSLANQADCRTVLMDLDLKQPGLGRLLGLKKPSAMEDFLNGTCELHEVLHRYGDNLAIGINSRPVKFSAELLQSLNAAKALRDMRKRMTPDVILFDLPPMLPSDDVTAFLPNVDCAILVVAADQSTLDELDVCERELSERSNVAGVVLNRCRYGLF
ncbi:CpsD/CapB family tyrosine-protein kinase [Mycoplana ramosa]|uniref:CpsD/CapB family tyrosine-protein kinase n=1 Tax=Mycoplana ramosa TaxID=40837 RepID=A0ABW3Z256_MYCRA